MSEDEIRKYFNDNYLSYKIIEISLTDDDGKDLSEAEIKKGQGTAAEVSEPVYHRQGLRQGY